MNPKALITLIAIGFSCSGYSQDSIWKAKALGDAGVLKNVKAGGQNRDTAETILEFDFLANGEMGTFGIAITKDSAFHLSDAGDKDSAFYVANADKGERYICNIDWRYKLLGTDWKNLISSIEGIKLSEIEKLSESQRYKEDEYFQFSRIDIVTNKGKYYSGFFDDYNPNEKLVKLMTMIQEIESRK